MFYEEILEEVFDKDILEVLGDTRRFWRIFIFKNIGILSHAGPTSHKRPSKIRRVSGRLRESNCRRSFTKRHLDTVHF